QLRDVEVGRPYHQRGHHEGDGKNDFGSAAHVLKRATSRYIPHRHGRFGMTSLPRTLPDYSSLPDAASAAALPYSFSLLCSVFKLIPRISAARVLLLLVASRVLRISNLSASSTVVPTPRRTASGSSAEVRTGV